MNSVYLKTELIQSLVICIKDIITANTNMRSPMRKVKQPLWDYETYQKAMETNRKLNISNQDLESWTFMMKSVNM